MKPLIQDFTKNLKPCSGCGNNGIWQLIPIKNDTMQFAIQIVVDAANVLEAIKQLDGKGEILSVNARPQPSQRPQVMLPTPVIPQKPA